MVLRTAVIVVVCCCLLASAVGPVAVAGTTQPNASPAVDNASPATADNDSPAVAGCFPDGGYEFTIGTQGPEIRMVLHMSLLTNLGGPGALGVELTGAIDEGAPIIELRTGVIFEGIDSVSGFLNDPFGPFSIAFEYMFELPMFGEEFAYEEDGAPIDGPVDDANC